ncbi:MAG: ATP-binding protein, partial [Acidobacteriota bacterium]|nr:ATP-binding protein [Acidobacteriota bacterium]
MTVASLTVPATPDFVRVASRFIVQTARHLGTPAVSSPLFEVAIAEALANAVKHGSRGRTGSMVTCQIERKPSGVSIRIYDDGEGFTPPPPKDLSTIAATGEVASLPESG